LQPLPVEEVDMQTRENSTFAAWGANLISLSALLVVACNAGTDGGDTVGGASEPLRSVQGAAQVAGAERDDAVAPSDAGYFTCDCDDDCVAVRLLSDCCYNGWKIAVARDEVEAYLEATTCAPAPRLCPEYVVLDQRVPACDPAAHRCVMVEPNEATLTSETSGAGAPPSR
jgi:hypothetical protein